MPRELRTLITGGGTGGHTVPALATVLKIRQRLVETFPGVTPVFLYVGSQHGLESRLASQAGLDFVSIATGKLRRASNPLRMLSFENLRDAFRVPLGFFQAVSIVRKFRPDVVFSTGGYVSVPAVLAAKLLHKRIIMHEQTVQIGLANRWCARVADKIALSFADSARELRPEDQKKTVVTGGVVRAIVLNGQAAKARKRYGFVDDIGHLPIVYITGGAQGSSTINKAVLESLPKLTEICCIIHQCGKQKIGSVQDEDLLKAAAAKLPDNHRKRYFVVPFVGDEIGDIFAAADLVVGRSGAGTVCEVCAVGKPAIFVPLVPTGGDEQTRNARKLEEIGAADVIRQSEFNSSVLVQHIAALLGDRPKLLKMGLAAKTKSTPHAAEHLADAVIKLGLG